MCEHVALERDPVSCCKEWSLVTGDVTFNTATGSSQHFSNLLLTEGRTVCDIRIPKSFTGVFFLKDDTKSAALAVPDKPTLYETSFSFPSWDASTVLMWYSSLETKD